jgi:hypothetical protein
MLSIPSDRQQQILDRLMEKGVVRVEELSNQLGVSTMTVHRDLDLLEQSGLLVKVRGGAVPPRPPSGPDECMICRMRPRRRLQVILHFVDGSEGRACCPHCGLIAVARVRERVAAALVTDFLYERPVSAREAVYLIGADVTICCTPTVLAFEQTSDAERFQRGFNGRLMPFEDAVSLLQQLTTLGGDTHHAP